MLGSSIDTSINTQGFSFINEETRSNYQVAFISPEYQSNPFVKIGD
jgi:hypothetical protein